MQSKSQYVASDDSNPTAGSQIASAITIDEL